METNEPALMNLPHDRQDSGIGPTQAHELGFFDIYPNQDAFYVEAKRKDEKGKEKQDLNQDVVTKSLLFRKELIGRKQAIPLESWSKSKSFYISLIRKVYYSLSPTVDLGQYLMTGIKSTRPAPRKIKVQKVKIPRITDWNIPSVSESNHEQSVAVKETMNGEWLYKASSVTNPCPRVILFVHSGAYVIGSRRMVRNITWRIADAGNVAVLAISYRLAPKHTFPAALEDVLSAYSYLMNPPKGSGFPAYKPEQISLAGNSAGGGAVAAAMIYCRETGRLPIPGAVIGLSPWYDMTQSFPAWWLNETFDYLPASTPDPKYTNQSKYHCYLKSNKDLKNPYASPIYYSDKNDQDSSADKPALPPMLIQVGGAERVRDDGIVFSERNFPDAPIVLEIYKDEVHDFGILCGLTGDTGDVGDYAIKRLAQFVEKYTSDGNQSQEISIPSHEAFYISSVEKVDPFHYPLGIVQDGSQVLINSGIWKKTDSTWLVPVTNSLNSNGNAMLKQYLESVESTEQLISHY